MTCRENNWLCVLTFKPQVYVAELLKSILSIAYFSYENFYFICININ